MTPARRILTFLFVPAALLITCAPAMAQSASPSASQYVDCSSGADTTACAGTLDVGDGVDDFAENAGQGTDAVNEAMTDSEASTASSAPSTGSERVASITRLPETGGAPAAALGSGVILVTLGLAVRRIF